MTQLFNTVYGRGLVPELKNSVHRPYLVVTMEDLWPRFADEFDEHLVGPLFVGSLEREDLDRTIRDLPAVRGGHRPRRRAGTRRRQVRRVGAAAPALPGADGHVRERRLGAPRRRPDRRRGAVRRLGGPRGRLRRLRRHRRCPGRPQPVGRGRHHLLPHRPLGLADGARSREDRAPVAVRRAPGGGGPGRVPARRGSRERHPRRERRGDPRARGVPPLGRLRLPQRGVEPAPHRGRGALRVLLSRVPDEPAVRPRTDRGPRRAPHERAPGQPTGMDQGGGRPDRRPVSARADGSDLGPGRGGDADDAPGASSAAVSGTPSRASAR